LELEELREDGDLEDQFNANEEIIILEKAIKSLSRKK